MYLTTTYLELDEPMLTLARKSGLFYKKKVVLNDVSEIFAINRSAVTHDEIQICFTSINGEKLFISENDKYFREVVGALEKKFPGIANWERVGQGAVFENRILSLWVRE